MKAVAKANLTRMQKGKDLLYKRRKHLRNELNVESSERMENQIPKPRQVNLPSKR